MSPKKTKKPADHLPAAGELITIETSAGKVRIEKFAPTAGFIRKNRHKDEVEIMFLIIEQFADEQALETIDQLPITELKDFFAQWQEESGAILGES